MGVVYIAADTHTETKVAVKLLRSELIDDAQMGRRFARESAALRALTHPNIVRVLDSGVNSADRAYLVTELMDGRTLADVIADGPLQLDESRRFLLQACDALSKAHAHGVIHGDLKPSNLFVVDEQGQRSMKVFDFGASKILGLDRLTLTGELAGTPKYMAPEVLKGSRAIDGRIDVYALGLIAYEALSGRSPFSQNNSARLLFAIAQGDATPLEEVADVPSDVQSTVHKALHRDAEDRFESVDAMAESIAAWGQS